MKQQFICERRPKADPRNIVLGKNYRITFLTDRLVRFEYNESGAFVDEASQVIWYRDLEEVPFEIKQKVIFLLYSQKEPLLNPCTILPAKPHPQMHRIHYIQI